MTIQFPKDTSTRKQRSDRDSEMEIETYGQVYQILFYGLQIGRISRRTSGNRQSRTGNMESNSNDTTPLVAKDM